MLVLALCATAGPGSAQVASEGDPMVTSAPVWDADQNGIYTCDEWKQYACRMFNLADRNPRFKESDETQIRSARALFAQLWAGNPELPL
jgi:hypothetical protein